MAKATSLSMSMYEFWAGLPWLGSIFRKPSTPAEIARLVHRGGGKLVGERSVGKFNSLSFEFKNIAMAKIVYETLKNDRPQRKLFGIVPLWLVPLRPHVYVEALQTLDEKTELFLSSKITIRSRTPVGLAFVKAIRLAYARQ